MRLRRCPDALFFLPKLMLTLFLVGVGVGCRFDTDYISAAEQGSLEPVECPQEGGSVITRLVDMNTRFVPESGTTHYSVVFSFLPIDPGTTLPTGQSVRHIAAPTGASQGDASGLDFQFYTCVLEGAYEVTALVVRRDIADSAPLFVSDCEGQVTAIGTSVAFGQPSVGAPVTVSQCLAAL